MIDQVRLYVTIGAVVLIALSTLIALSLVVRHVIRIDASVRRLHLQQANIIAMLLKAGFRPAKSLDWFDDGDRTRVAGDTVHTQFDWKDPNGDVPG